MVDLPKSDDDRKVLEIFALSWSWDAPSWRRRACPDRIEELRAAFMATVKDADFLADIAKLNFDIEPMPGAELQAFIARIIPDPDRARQGDRTQERKLNDRQRRACRWAKARALHLCTTIPIVRRAHQGPCDLHRFSWWARRTRSLVSGDAVPTPFPTLRPRHVDLHSSSRNLSFPAHLRATSAA